MFCIQCGQPIAETSNFCGQCGTKVQASVSKYSNTSAASSKDDIMTAIAEALSRNDQLTLTFRQKADIEVFGILSDANWMVGKKKLEYFASILAETESQTIIFWEMMKETSCGLEPIFSFKTEKFYSDGKTISGTVAEYGSGINGKIIDYQWDYSQIRRLIQKITLAKGWRFKTVLSKGNASY